MRATELKQGDIIEYTYGAMYPTEEMTVIGVDSKFSRFFNETTYFAVAVDSEGNEKEVTGTSAPSANGSPIGWTLVS
jgi:predicted Fe-Mo cluster-binding NifX family protein